MKILVKIIRILFMFTIGFIIGQIVYYQNISKKSIVIRISERWELIITGKDFLFSPDTVRLPIPCDTFVILIDKNW